MTSSSLIDDISDELLVCRICLESLRRPKTLTCRHSFCELCLERLRDFELPTDDGVRVVSGRRTSTVSGRSAGQVRAARLTCPVCYESCPLPPGGVSRLPDDPVVAQLYNVIARRKSAAAAAAAGQQSGTDRTCDICQPRHRSVHVKCVDCDKFMCSPCARLHRRTNVTSGHSLLDVDNAELSLECEHHSGELVRFYCDTCHVCVCVLCTYAGQPHSADDHDVLSFSDAVATHQPPLTALLADCKQRLDDMRARYDDVVTFDQLIRKVEDSIHEVAMETVSYVRSQERQLVAALQALCADGDGDGGAGDGETRRANVKKALSEHVRRLQDACDDGGKLLSAVSEGSPAAFLLQRRHTGDTMTSLMTSQTTGVANWPKYKSQVRFEAYGLDSALGLHIGRLVIDEDGNDEVDSQKTERRAVISAADTDSHCDVTVPRCDVTIPCVDVDGGECIERKLSDVSVQTDELDESVTPTSRCEASGGLSSSTARLSASHDQLTMTGTSPTSARRRLTSPSSSSPVPSSSSSSSSSSTTAAATAGTQSERSTSLCDASTSTTVVTVLSASTATDRLDTRDQSTNAADVVCYDQQLQTNSDQSRADVRHCATSTDQLEMCSVGLTAAPLTHDQSTSTIHLIDNADDTQTKSTDVDKDLSTASNDTNLQTLSSCPSRVDGGFLESTVTALQPAAASNFNVPHSTSPSVAGSVNLATGLARQTSALNANMSPSGRLVALLPDIARTADVLAASYFSYDLTAQLLREIVDVGLEMASTCGRDAATDTTDSRARGVTTTACRDVKWTQTVAVGVMDAGVGDSAVVTTSDASTLAKLAPTMFDKETLTTRAHQVNKNIATDSLSTADKQTWMPVDIATAYLACTSAMTRRVVSVSRGTMTPTSFTAPPRQQVDRASSPVRVMLVDKSVMASKAEALEPVDTFRAAGQLSGPLSPLSRRPLSLSPRSKLACISEAAERYDEEEKAEDSEDVTDSETSHARSSQRALRTIQTPTRLQQQQQQLGQLSRNIFNFDHVVTSRFATLSRSTSLDDGLQMTSSVADAANLSPSAAQTTPVCSTHHVHLPESQLPLVDK